MRYQQLRTETLIFLLVALVMAYLFQGSRGLLEPSETRYAECSREMLESGNWLIPLLDGKTHLTKPPLAYWSIMSGMLIFGENEWGVRFFNALAFVLTALFVRSLGTRMGGPRLGILAGWIYLTSPFPYFTSNIVTTDTVLTLWKTLGVWCYWNAFLEENVRKAGYWSYALWITFGLAFLTKGPPALLPLIPILLHSIQFKRHPWQATVIFNWLAISTGFWVGMSWFLFMILRDPNILSYFIKDEIYGRVFTDMYHRNEHWWSIPKVYGLTLILGAFPWALMLALASLYKGFRQRAAALFYRNSDNNGSLPLLIFWFCLPLLVFIFSQSRLPLYILGLFSPLSLLTARAILWLQSQQRYRAVFSGARGRMLLQSFLIFWCLFLLIVKWEAAHWKTAFTKDNWDARQFYQNLNDTVQIQNCDLFVLTQQPIYGLEFYSKKSLTQLYDGNTRSHSWQEEPLEDTLKTLGEKSNRFVFILNHFRENEVKNRLLQHQLDYHIHPLVYGYVAIDANETVGWNR